MSTLTVKDKQTSYRLLTTGYFGNTIPVWFSLYRWERDAIGTVPTWGVRTLTPGGPCRLHVPAALVPATFEGIQNCGHTPCISAMVSNVARTTLAVDVWDAPGGLVVCGAEYPDPLFNWREMMRNPRTWRGVEARNVLARHLNPSSLADLEVLRDRVPGHVYELSALDKCYGTVPGRNAVVWEVRMY